MEAKHLAVFSNEKSWDIVVRPGTSTADIRRQTGLPAEFMLSPRQGLPFGEHEDLFGLVRDGDKIFASPPATVGRVG